jgi:hypothetical protein
MTILSQLAVSLAIDLGLQRDIPSSLASRRPKSRRLLTQFYPNPNQEVRTMEERRTILALLHLSLTWVLVSSLYPCHADRRLQFAAHGPRIGEQSPCVGQRI